MTIIQLEYLLAVVNHGSFSIAAKHCFVTQPSLSMQIGNLEDELGAILLYRNQKPIVVTEAGMIVLEQAKKTLAAFYGTKESMNELRGKISGTLRIGVIPTISPYLIPGFICNFTKKYTDVKLDIYDMHTANLIEALSRDVIDIGILSGGQSEIKIRETSLFNDELYAYVSPKHELFGRKMIVTEDIDIRRLLLLSEGNCLRNQTLRLCKARKTVKTEYNFVNNSLETLMHMVDITPTMTIIPNMTIGFIPKEKRQQIIRLGKNGAHRKITMAVGHTYIKESIVKGVRESIMATAADLAVSKFLVP